MEGRRPSPDLAIGELAGGQHGVVSRGQLRALGLSDSAIEARIRRGALRSLHRGVYAVGHLALTQEGRWMAAVLACGEGAVLSHRSAGQLWHLLPRFPIPPELTRPYKFKVRRGIVCRRAEIPADEIEVVDGITVTSVARTLLPDLMARYPRRRGAKVLRGLLGAAAPTGIVENDFEELFAVFLEAHGLPRPRFNATLALRGRFIKPDCMWARQRLIVELDGRATHGTDRAFESDRERDRILLAEGWRSMRVTWRQLRDEPAAIAADLWELLRGEPGPPTL